MRCIFCDRDRPGSLEHVFPLAIGGKLTTERVCSECNSTLGSRVDSALTDFLPIRIRRAELGLVGNAKTAPGPLEILLGTAELAGEGGRRIQTSYDPVSGTLDHRLLYHSAEIVRPDGTKVRQISVDARDRDQIQIIIQRERRRNNLSPLSEEELAEQVAAAVRNASTISNLAVKKDIKVSFAFVRHAMLKIVYELAFLWLGEAYLDDPVAAVLRSAISSPDLASTDSIEGYIGPADDCEALNKFWTPHREHHLAFAAELYGEQIILGVRIFDLYSAVVPITMEPSRYAPLEKKLRFIAIDAKTGRSLNSSFQEERLRLAEAMTAARRIPPFPDPL